MVYICKIHNQWEFAIRFWELTLVLCYNLEMWMGWKVRERFKRGDLCIPMADSC